MSKLDFELVQIIEKHPDGVSIERIRDYYDKQIHIRTLQRKLARLVEQGSITIAGKARSTVYKPVVSSPPIAVRSQEPINLIPISSKGLAAQEMVTAPIQQRQLVGYQQKFLQDYRPNEDNYLSTDEKEKLAKLGNTNIDQPAGTYAQQILNRLLIDLSWNSSRLEGNTYGLLDTERLIEQGQADDTKTAKEAQMILNHKDAIEFIVQAAEEIGFNRYTLLNLHAMLANNLLPDPQAPGRLRVMPVGISGSAYTPLAIPQLIEQFFELILEKASQIEDPFEQSFFMMVHLPYLQPFDDVNKRVSRLAANISLVKKNLPPLSFIDVPEDLYFQGIMAVYELNDINLLKEVFLWAYERSATRYAVIRQSLGEPDTFKLKYRTQIRDLIQMIILRTFNSKDASKIIRDEAESLPEIDRAHFIRAVETELSALHEGNSARYRVSNAEFKKWNKIWRK